MENWINICGRKKHPFSYQYLSLGQVFILLFSNCRLVILVYSKIWFGHTNLHMQMQWSLSFSSLVQWKNNTKWAKTEAKSWNLQEATHWSYSYPLLLKPTGDGRTGIFLPKNFSLFLSALDTGGCLGARETILLLLPFMLALTAMLRVLWTFYFHGTSSNVFQ